MHNVPQRRLDNVPKPANVAADVLEHTQFRLIQPLNSQPRYHQTPFEKCAILRVVAEQADIF